MPSFPKTLLAAAMLALAACGLRPTPEALTPAAATATLAAVTPDAGATPDITQRGPAMLDVWLPPEFGPESSQASSEMLADHLAAFEAAHPGTGVRVRIKAASGPGGLLNALANSASAAPNVLPNLVALQRDDLALAAAAGLVLPLEERVPAASLADYYPYAQQMGRVNNAWFGLPFAADAHVMVYLTGVYSSPPLTFSDIVTGTFVLPAADSNALTLLNVYLALGGSLANEDGELALDSQVLARALLYFQSLHTSGTLPLSTLEHADTTATWQLFRDRRANLAVTSAQWYMLEYFRVEGAAATLLPTGGEPQMALVDGWSWAIVNTQPEHLARTGELLAWLTDPAWQAAWTEAAPVLPTRASTLAGWSSRRLVPFVSDVVTHAQLQPPAASLAIVGPPLRDALTGVINGRSTPMTAASTAANAVNPP